MKWIRLGPGHYVTNMHDGAVILLEDKKWNRYKHGQRSGQYRTLRLAKIGRKK